MKNYLLPHLPRIIAITLVIAVLMLVYMTCMAGEVKQSNRVAPISNTDYMISNTVAPISNTDCMISNTDYVISYTVAPISNTDYMISNTVTPISNTDTLFFFTNNPYKLINKN